MADRVLAGKRESIAANSDGLEDFPMFVEPVESIPELAEGCLIVHVAPRDVAELKESTERLHHCLRDVTFNSSKVDLHDSKPQ
jgi:hypothetical protein